MDHETPLLDIDDLTVDYRTRDATVRAVTSLSLQLAEGEAVGVVGESGSGKSTVANALMRLLPANARVTRGSIRYLGRDLLQTGEKDMQSIRGGQIALVGQDPMTALNPVMTIGRQISEALRAHGGRGGQQERDRVHELLEMVRLPSPGVVAKRYPHQLSGGQRQRVAIALAVSCSPRLLIADEPTTALDVSIQDQILRLLGRLRSTLGMAVVVISHNLGVVSALADRVVIMYRSHPVETGPTPAVLHDPRHPYSRGLVGAIPDLWNRDRSRLTPIDGHQATLLGDEDECSFADRCAHVQQICRSHRPALETYAPDRAAACARLDAVRAAVATKDR